MTVEESWKAEYRRCLGARFTRFSPTTSFFLSRKTTSQMETCYRYQNTLPVGRDNEHRYSTSCVSSSFIRSHWKDISSASTRQIREHMRLLL
ncbi:hypothetical protein I7I50_07656 [Histoplasma capsulatum G186AR]|uniref:Uncharacterized protein n=1 Tax=Ajellomyces capsulatus TaxID=5037 RepID=A0A8H7Z0Z1_AJECA|nr:hypothetical protein I7I52_09272 [Histoplasma capsulatum]QSS68296.1 hypothetical protein I7I50_07656 [Histoplasma capsulatum G186AR]